MKRGKSFYLYNIFLLIDDILAQKRNNPIHQFEGYDDIKTDSRTINANPFSKEMEKMSWKERHGAQINYAWDFLNGKDESAGEKLAEINKYNVEELKKEGIIENSITIADFGNFVISPELLSEIEGHRSNFQPLISKLEYKETLSLEMAWLRRSGDIDMAEVELCDDDADAFLVFIPVHFFVRSF